MGEGQVAVIGTLAEGRPSNERQRHVREAVGAVRRALIALVLGATATIAPAIIRVRTRKRTTPLRVVHVIGDSHVSLFSGRDEMVGAWPRPSRDLHPRFRTYRLGPALAYRLPDARTTSRGRERLLTVLAFGGIPRAATVLLSFGEIDCRYHLPRVIECTGRPAEEVVRECVSRYASVVREVRDLGFDTLVWGVIPALEQDPSGEDAEYPHWGTAEKRNDVIRRFNDLLSRELSGDGIPVVSVFDRLIGTDGTLPDARWYMDRVHLSSAALPVAIEALDHAFGLRAQASQTKS